MATGDVKYATYPNVQNLTVTALNAGLASSATWVAGWSSQTIDNTSNLYDDYILTGNILVESSGLTAGYLNLWAYTMLDPTAGTWPDIFSSGTEGSQGAATLHDTEIRDGLIPIWSQQTDTTASRNYPIQGVSLLSMMRVIPPKFAFFFAHSTVAALETSGQVINIQGVYYNVAS